VAKKPISSDKSWIIYACVKSGRGAQIREVCEIPEAGSYASEFQAILTSLLGLSQSDIQVSLEELSGWKRRVRRANKRTCSESGKS